jgi:hypothetical protein
MTERYYREINTCALEINLESVRISVGPANVPPYVLPTAGATPAPPSAVALTWRKNILKTFKGVPSSLGCGPTHAQTRGADFWAAPQVGRALLPRLQYVRVEYQSTESVRTSVRISVGPAYAPTVLPTVGFYV